MPVSKRLRYEVFRRDNFTCRYCGAKPPEVQLRPDHVVPVALGGTDDPSNLATSCDACNSGKTSTTPDAPIVADVSDDALRWARAMAVAAEQMRSEMAGRQEVYERVNEQWAGWTYGGDQRLPLPRPNDWQSSVDSFLAAGLPLDVLCWCIDKAMTSKAKPEQTWRYMCGIAWRKVSELQEAARGIAAGDGEADPAQEDDDRALEQWFGRYRMACDLLDRLSQEEHDWYLADARSRLDGNEQDAVEGAAFRAFYDAIQHKRSLIQALGVVLGRVEGGGTALEAAHAQLEAEQGAPPGYPEWYCLAVRMLTSNEPVRIGDIL